MDRNYWQKNIRGYLDIEIHGKDHENFLNLALGAGIILRNIRRISGQPMRAQIMLADVRSLRQIARTSHCRFTIRHRHGLPFLLAAIGRRKALFGGALIFFVLLYLTSTMVFAVSVESPYPLKDEEKAHILSIAKQYGITASRFNWQIDLVEAEKQILLAEPSLIFAKVRPRGHSLIITVVKRTDIKEEDKPEPIGSIIAQTDGLIDTLLVHQGAAAVKIGDSVKAGDTLIWGYNATELIPADGIIHAKTWYQGYGEWEITKTGIKTTGKFKQRLLLAWRGKPQVIIYGNNKPPYQQFSLETRALPLIIWRKNRLPVELLVETYYEEEEYNETCTAEQAFNNALAIAKAAAIKQAPQDTEIVAIRAQEIITADNIKRVTVTIEVIEEIGVFVPATETDKADLATRQKLYAEGLEQPY